LLKYRPHTSLPAKTPSTSSTFGAEEAAGQDSARLSGGRGPVVALVVCSWWTWLLEAAEQVDPGRPASASYRTCHDDVGVDDDTHVAFMDENSAGTIANLRHDSRLEINSVDFPRRRGYRLEGRAGPG
jgi:hypothetical protein